VVDPLGQPQRFFGSHTFPYLEALHQESLPIDRCETLDLMGEGEPFSETRIGGKRAGEGIRELDDDVGRRSVPFVAIHEDAAPKETIAFGMMCALSGLSFSLKFRCTRKSRGHELKERKKMGTSEGAAKLKTELLCEACVEGLSSEFDEARRGIAAALSPRDLGGFDGDVGLVDLNVFDLSGRRIEIDLDAHHVNDARRLDVVVRWDEAVFSQVDDIATSLPTRFCVTSDGDSQGPSMERKSLDQGRRGVGEGWQSGRQD
jgi:hypothetical protein